MSAPGYPGESRTSGRRRRLSRYVPSLVCHLFEQFSMKISTSNCHSPADCNVVGVVSFCFRICCFSCKNISSKFATLQLVLADRRATARTTTRWAMQHPDKKKKPMRSTCLIQSDTGIKLPTSQEAPSQPVSKDFCRIWWFRFSIPSLLTVSSITPLAEALAQGVSAQSSGCWTPQSG